MAAVARTSYSCFATAAPGLEEIVGAELRALGYQGRVEIGGVAFRTDSPGLIRANIALRAASRIVVRINHFEAPSFSLLEARARRIPWEAWLAPGASVRFRVTTHKSRLYHQDAIAQRMIEAVAHRIGGVGASADLADEENGDGSERLFIVRLAQDQCMVSVDSSGALLHRRGYRHYGGKAPIRETLAAGMLLAIGWNGGEALLDPFCGSGTIPIEAALLARRMAPNLPRAIGRELACQQWPSFQESASGPVIDQAVSQALPAGSVPILGSDRDGAAIDGARFNAARAAVSEVEFRTASLGAVVPPAASGVVVTNPPYGVRIGDEKKLRGLYGQLGKMMDTRLSGWKLAMLETHRGLRRFSGLTMQDVLATRNGGIKVRLVTSDQ